ATVPEEVQALERKNPSPPAEPLLPGTQARWEPRAVDPVAGAAPPRRCPHAPRLGAAVGGGGADGDPERSRVSYDSGHHFGRVYRRGGRREERALVRAHARLDESRLLGGELLQL